MHTNVDPPRFGVGALRCACGKILKGEYEVALRTCMDCMDTEYERQHEPDRV